MKCPYCKGNMVLESLDYKVEREGQTLLVEDVPTWVCEMCDETLLDDEVIEAVEEMLAELKAGLAEREDLPEIDLSE